MKKIKRYKRYNSTKLLLLIFLTICFFPAEVAGKASLFIDHFNSPKLNSMWNIKPRNGGYFINDWRSGRLALISSRIEEGVYLNYNRQINIQEGVSFEVKLDSSYLTDDINIGFADQIMIPGENGEVNAHILAGIAIVGNGWWTRTESGLKEGTFQKGWHIFSVRVSGNFIEVYVDEVYVGKRKRVSGPLYFCISADAYTNYYTAKVIIDYIKISYGE